MKELTWMTYLMLILASYRLTHLVVFDKITEFIRKPFMKKIEIQTDHGTETKNVPKSMFGYLLNCYWCTGIWSAIFLGTAYLLIPKVTFVIILILSIAGGQSILESFVGVNIKRVSYLAHQQHEQEKKN
ncbi:MULTISPECIES: DUF1360 domain-containing protein [unclassified Bacillus (in: firmicutes)]|uniref:DUF1360 domain-containing protein n=1 Tax=unclassified Bacillus (in: firmicutes) TaxID=185979 RepID=UPI0008ED1CBF|nr:MULTISPECIES: DUF1360 domain-containing protein [unclassified Bacillus (in: firmicutes)]SFB08269.1 Protein of unknown function [Bacillus sp. UNCCL13]SFQ87122.1 Protein of unknown function [Bacillus sp. cl95]